MSWEDKGSQRKQRKPPAIQAQEHYHTLAGSGRWGAMQGTGILIDITAKVLHHYR